MDILDEYDELLKEKIVIAQKPVPIPPDQAQREAWYKTFEGKTLIQAVWVRAKERCERCGADHPDLLLHHKLRFDIPELRSNPNNYVLLCPACEVWVYSPENEDKQYRIFLQDI